MNLLYSYLQTKILEGTIYYGYHYGYYLIKDCAWDYWKSNKKLITDPMWNKELQKRYIGTVIVDLEEPPENEIEVIEQEDEQKEQEEKQESKSREIEIQTGKSLANFSDYNSIDDEENMESESEGG